MSEDLEPTVETTDLVEETVEVAEVDAVETTAEEVPSEEKVAEEKLTKRNSFQERINQKTREAKEAQALATSLQERLASYEQTIQPSQSRPKLEDFDYDEQRFNEALDSWTSSSLSTSVRQVRLEEQRQEAKNAQQRTLAIAQETFVERANDFELDNPDFRDVVSKVPNSQVLTSAVLMAEDGPALAYHLGKNPGIAKELAEMNPYMAMLEIGKISARLSTKAPTKLSSAPPPSKTVGSSAAVSKDPDKMSPDEYRRHRGYSR